MAAKAASLLYPKKKSRKRNAENLDEKPLSALPWNPSLPDEDPFAILAGTNNLEGGFFSLEEIDEAEYTLGIHEPGEAEESKKEHTFSLKSNKRKRRNADNGGYGDYSQAGCEEKREEEKKIKKKKKKTKKENEVASTDLSCVSTEEPVNDAKDEVDSEKAIDEAEFYAWNELRLHPLLMKSIHKLKFKEPTPIQKACIPAAASKGKDVIGAAVTGSGKTLAFGLPILQRLLEEREKDAKSLSGKGSEMEKGVRGSPLRALIITPTRELALQVTDHLKKVAKLTNIRVVSIVGGMSTEKQERLLKARPEIVVGTPGRLWELMSGGDHHLVELHSLSFFVLDEADRMVESGHFRELQSIIDMLPMTGGSIEGHSQIMQKKKRQTFVFSATVALSADFRKKLKHGLFKSKQSMSDGLSSIENLSERAGMRDDVAIIDLTNASIMADKLEESFIECGEEDKDAHLYYLLSVHGQGRTIVFCTSIAALRHISSLLRILGINIWTLHAQMQQRARLKAVDRFRGNEHGVLVATDVAARGIDIPDVRTVIHYQLPHSAEVYIHRSGRTARASADGCSIVLISPSDRSKFAFLCKSFSKESLRRFPFNNSYMPEVVKRLSLAFQIDKISRKDSQDKANKSWLDRNAESVELVVEDDDSEEERVKNYKQKKTSSVHLKKLQQELTMLLSRPLQPKSLSHRFLAGAGVSPLLQEQFQELARQKSGNDKSSRESKRTKMVVIGQDFVEPLQALRSSGLEVRMDVKEKAEKQRNIQDLRKKRREEKKRLHDQRRKERKKMKRNQ